MQEHAQYTQPMFMLSTKLHSLQSKQHALVSSVLNPKDPKPPQLHKKDPPKLDRWHMIYPPWQQLTGLQQNMCSHGHPLHLSGTCCSNRSTNKRLCCECVDAVVHRPGLRASSLAHAIKTQLTFAAKFRMHRDPKRVLQHTYMLQSNT